MKRQAQNNAAAARVVASAAARGGVAAPGRKNSSRCAPSVELAQLRTRLGDAEEALRAIRCGEVDTVMDGGKNDSQVFTLKDANRPYRMLIESMNEGALTLTVDKSILYANQCFANMVRCPLEQVTGSSFRRFLSAADQARLRPLTKRSAKTGSKTQVLLHASDGSLLPALLSVRKLAHEGSQEVIIGMVVTDMTQARRNEELLRTITQRVLQAQEAERGRVALELHDGITQMLCALIVHSQALVNKLAPHERTAKCEAMKLCAMAGEAVKEVERISHNLRPSVLDQLGLVAALRDTSTEFAKRTGLIVKLTCLELTATLPADTEWTLYRILQEALQNVEKHARARHVTVTLTQRNNCVQLAIKDDGTGFDPAHQHARLNAKGGFGLLGMGARAAGVGGTHQVKSSPRAGTTIVVCVPLTRNAGRSIRQTDL